MRACTQNGGAAGINVDELVFGVPNFRIVNAAFTYAHPQGSRFNDGRRGAWYCAFDAERCQLPQGRGVRGDQPL
jgi:hypothetical protein